MTTTSQITMDDIAARFDPVIGLETHVELGTVSKMFCGCPTDFGAEPNTQTCPVCLGLPGALPVVNVKSIESTIRIGLALNATIASWCRFARKNYFYPDMPKDFQISQYDEPLCTDGYLDLLVDGEPFRVEIERVHLEEDTGKSLHVGGATGRIHGADHSLVDYNRAGIPLVEIVTKPIPGTGARAPVVARAYVTELRELLRGLDVSDVRMEQGSMRCDVNTSLAPKGAAEWGTRTETKNVNSLRSVERAVRSEMIRQTQVLDEGGRIIQETRHFHEDTSTTTSGRSKEEATDYRYFPEPDLVPVAPDPAWVEELRATLPDAPSIQRKQVQDELGMTDSVFAQLKPGAATLVSATIKAGASVEDASKWWLGDLSRRANAEDVELADLAITPVQVAGLARLVADGKVNDRLARQVLEGVLAGEGDPEAVVAARGLAIVSDTGALDVAVDAAIAENPEVVAKIQSGKVAAVGVLLGSVMKATRGQADAASVKAMIAQRLDVDL